MQKSIIIIILASFSFYSCSIEKDSVSINSPDDQIKMEVFLEENQSTDSTATQLYYNLTYKETEVLSKSAFRLDFEGMPSLGRNMKINDWEIRDGNDNYQKTWGRSSMVNDPYKELIISLEEKSDPERQMKFIIRLYNDGAAFRYTIPVQPGVQDFQLTSELSTFNFTEDHTVWAANYKGFVSHQEGEFNKMKLSDIGSNIMGCPLLVMVNENVWAAITEADLTDWAGMYLSSYNGSETTLRTVLSPRHDNPDILVKGTSTRQSPWRVIMLADNPGKFIETNIISNLNDPCQYDDVTWINPGLSAWDPWWNNYYAPDADFEVGSNTETMKYFIDFAAEMDWDYQLIDIDWYGQQWLPDSYDYNPESDITTSNPNLDIPYLVEYASEKDVKLMLWMMWQGAEKQMDEAFPLYEKWGISGIKVDFMQRDDQEMVNFYHHLVKKAAEHKLLVNFHGSYKPTGVSRTYPNLMTREGVLGNEFSKWGKRITPEHTTTLPFTRGILGEMDFTPGAFVNVYPEDFKTDDQSPSPMVMGTRCNQLAMMVVFESPIQTLCDSPYNYRNSPAGLDFLKIVPATWDETRFIHGFPGEYVTVARRKGDTWYVGSMTNSESRNLNIPLNFLIDGNWKVKIWQDVLSENAKATDVKYQEKEINNTSVIETNLSRGGGHVMVIEKR